MRSTLVGGYGLQRRSACTSILAAYAASFIRAATALAPASAVADDGVLVVEGVPVLAVCLLCPDPATGGRDLDLSGDPLGEIHASPSVWSTIIIIVGSSKCAGVTMRPSESMSLVWRRVPVATL